MSCSKCHRELDDAAKSTGVPICKNCVKEIAEGLIHRYEMLENMDKAIIFGKHILFSANLMRVNSVEEIQVYASLFVNSLSKVSDDELYVMKPMFVDIIEAANIGLNKINGLDENIVQSSDRAKRIFEEMASRETSSTCEDCKARVF